MCKFGWLGRKRVFSADKKKLRAWIKTAGGQKSYQHTTGHKMHTGIGNESRDDKQQRILNILCPYCHSKNVIDAGYGGRTKCRNCSHIFS